MRSYFVKLSALGYHLAFEGKVYYLLLFFIVSLYSPLICMESSIHGQIVNLKLDDNQGLYPIARWKVVQEPNIVPECCDQQTQNNIIIIPGVTTEEINLYDQALDATIIKQNGKQSFSEYFKGLSDDQKYTLTVVSNKLSTDDNTKKLKAERLKYQLSDELIDLELIKKENIALGMTKKKFILTSYLKEYKEVFDYLLISIIRDNICNNCVKIEEADSFTLSSANAFIPKEIPDGAIKYVSKMDGMNGLNIDGCNINIVTTFIPLSSMVCVGMRAKDDTSYVKVDDYCSDEYIGTLLYKQKNINVVGITKNLRNLVTLFDNDVALKTQLYSDNDLAGYNGIRDKIKLVDICLLLQLYRAKMKKEPAQLHDSEYDYIRNYLSADEKGKEFIQKHFL